MFSEIPVFLVAGIDIASTRETSRRVGFKASVRETALLWKWVRVRVCVRVWVCVSGL